MKIKSLDELKHDKKRMKLVEEDTPHMTTPPMTTPTRSTQSRHSSITIVSPIKLSETPPLLNTSTSVTQAGASDRHTVSLSSQNRFTDNVINTVTMKKIKLTSTTISSSTLKPNSQSTGILICF